MSFAALDPAESICMHIAAVGLALADIRALMNGSDRRLRSEVR